MIFWLVGLSLAALIAKSSQFGEFDNDYVHELEENDWRRDSDDFGLHGGDVHLSEGLAFGHDADHGFHHDPYDDYGLEGNYREFYNQDFDNYRGPYGFDAYGYGAGSDGKYGHGGFAYKGYGPPGFDYRGGNPALRKALRGKPLYAAGAKLEMGHGGVASPLNVITNAALHGNFNPLRNFGYGGLGGLSNKAAQEINYYRLKQGLYPLDPNDLDGDGEADHLTKTKHKIDEYIAKQWKLGKRKLTVSVNYGNMPLEYQYLGQYHGFPNPVAGTPLGQMFGLPMAKDKVAKKYGGGPYNHFEKHGFKGHHMRRGPNLPDLKYEAKYDVKHDFRPDFKMPDFHLTPIQPEGGRPPSSGPPSRPPPPPSSSSSNERPNTRFVPPGDVDYVPPGAAVKEGGSPPPPPPPPPKSPLPPPPAQEAEGGDPEETKKKPLWERLKEAWETDEIPPPPPQQMRPPPQFNAQFNQQQQQQQQPPRGGPRDNNNNQQPPWVASTQQQPSWMSHLADEEDNNAADMPAPLMGLDQMLQQQQQGGGGNNQFDMAAGMMMNPAQMQEQSAQHLQEQHNDIYPQGQNLQGNFEGGAAEYEPMPQAPTPPQGNQQMPLMGGGMGGNMGGGMGGNMGGGMGANMGGGMGANMGGGMGANMGGGMGGNAGFGGMGNMGGGFRGGMGGNDMGGGMGFEGGMGGGNFAGGSFRPGRQTMGGFGQGGPEQGGDFQGDGPPFQW